jgi:hypothetical protein
MRLQNRERGTQSNRPNRPWVRRTRAGILGVSLMAGSLLPPAHAVEWPDTPCLDLMTDYELHQELRDWYGSQPQTKAVRKRTGELEGQQWDMTTEWNDLGCPGCIDGCDSCADPYCSQ